MPFVTLHRPSMALGLLKAGLAAQDVSATVVYANLLFAHCVGTDLYAAAQAGPGEDLVGEWIFSEAAFPDHRPDADAYLAQIALHCYARPLDGQDPALALKTLRHHACAFVDALAAALVARRPRIVGCSSSYLQHCASLALLRRVRELEPTVMTLMGGANCEGEMGRATVRYFPWVDFVVSGEADALLGPLCQSLIACGPEETARALPAGVMASPRLISSAAPEQAVCRAFVRDVDDLPLPDFDAYFECLKMTGLDSIIRPELVIETARGCWWGQLHPCTFCGMNGNAMAYRSKSPERAVDEFAYLSHRYGVHRFYAVDTIMDMEYFRTVLPVLADRVPGLGVLYETKANLKRWQVQQLARAGVTSIQPGIESLDDRFLRLANKGVDTLQNLQLMRWARESGVHLEWLLLYGFPGECESWYHDLAARIPWLVHLEPPSGMIRIIFQRFSTYHTHPAAHGLHLVPDRRNAWIYPLSQEQLADLVCNFEDATPEREGDFDFRRWNDGLTAMLRAQRDWHRRFHSDPRPVLTMWDDGNSAHLLDTRFGTSRQSVLHGLARQVLLMLDKAASRRTLLDRLGSGGLAPTWDEVEAVLADLLARRVILQDADRYVSLVVAVESPAPPLHDGQLTSSPVGRA